MHTRLQDRLNLRLFLHGSASALGAAALASLAGAAEAPKA